jgi:mercuric ion transport protein
MIVGATDNVPSARPGEGAFVGHGQRLAAAGGLLGALAAASCCILPLALFSVGVSGAWIGHLTALAPYQPYFIGAAVALLSYGYWVAYRARKRMCADGKVCSRPISNRLVLAGFIVATALVAAAVGFDILAPILLDS